MITTVPFGLAGRYNVSVGVEIFPISVIPFLTSTVSLSLVGLELGIPSE
ncbi:MAG: hypothetical protein ACKOC0_04940 [Cytophagales bacterium]